MEGATQLCRTLFNERTRHLYRPLERKATTRQGLVSIPRLLPHQAYFEADVNSFARRGGFDKFDNAFSLEQVRRIADEYGVSAKNLNIYKNEYYLIGQVWEATSRISTTIGVGGLRARVTGFTKYGLEKISESIRAYSYLILSSQAAARHGILGTTAQSLAAQRIFYDNLEDVINKVVSLEDDIGRYQSTLKYARSTLDYSVGRGLYMLPSNLLLNPLIK